MAYTLFNRQGEIEVEPNFVKSCQVFIDLFDDYDTDDNTDPIPITESYNLDDVKLMTDYFSKINKFVIEYNSKEISYLDYITYHKDDYIINYTNNDIDPPYCKEIVEINNEYGTDKLERFIEMDSFFNNKKLIQAIVIYIVSYIRIGELNNIEDIIGKLLKKVQENMNE